METNVCCVLGDRTRLVIDMSTEFNPVIFFLSFFRIVKSEMSHVAEKVRSKFIFISRSCNLSMSRESNSIFHNLTAVVLLRDKPRYKHFFTLREKRRSFCTIVESM